MHVHSTMYNSELWRNIQAFQFEASHEEECLEHNEWCLHAFIFQTVITKQMLGDDFQWARSYLLRFVKGILNNLCTCSYATQHASSLLNLSWQWQPVTALEFAGFVGNLQYLVFIQSPSSSYTEAKGARWYNTNIYVSTIKENIGIIFDAKS